MWETGRSSDVRAETVPTNNDGDFPRSNISLGSSGVMGVMACYVGSDGHLRSRVGKDGYHDHVAMCTRLETGCEIGLSGIPSRYEDHGERDNGAQLSTIGTKALRVEGAW